MTPTWYTLTFFVGNFIENDQIRITLIIILIILIIPMGIILSKAQDKYSKDRWKYKNIKRLIPVVCELSSPKKSNF